MFPQVAPGTTFDAMLLLDVEREVPIEFVEVAFRGTEMRIFSNQPNSHLSLVRLSARVSGPRHLRPGRTEVPIKVPLPEEIPPSYEGRGVRTRYELAVHVAIPWWPDRHERFVVKVVRPSPPPAEPPTVLPGRFATSRRGPLGVEPYMEGSLANTNLEPGAVLSGAVALSNTTENRYRTLTVSLVAKECFPDPSAPDVEVKRYELDLPLDDLQEADPIPFHLAVPTGLHPTYRSKLWELRWYVEVRAEVAWRPDLRFLVPVKVWPDRGPKPALGPQIRVPPSIGSPRIEAIWREVAEKTGLGFTEEGMEGVAEGGVQISVRREPRRRRGNFLTGELRYPSLGIGLNVRSLRGLERHWGPPSLSFGDAAWDRKNQIEGRDPTQVLVFGRHVVDALWAFTGVHITDDAMVVERRGTGHDRRVLAQFVENVRELAHATARGREAIPAPSEMERAVPAWEELATRIHGSLEKASMSVVGSLHGMSVSVATVWADSGAVRHTRAELLLAMPLARKYVVSVAAPGELPALAGYPDEARELVTMIVDGAEAFSVTPDRLVLLLPGPLLEPVPFVSDRLEWMVQLCLALGRSGGPYR